MRGLMRTLKALAHAGRSEKKIKLLEARLGVVERRLYRDVIREFAKLITPSESYGPTFVRMGNQDADGGYVMLSAFDSVVAAYSLGIGDDVSWDLDIVKKNIPVYQYDCSIQEAPVRHDQLIFSPTCVGSIQAANFAELSTLLAKNGHAQHGDLILKMDIEGSEWDVFEEILDLQFLGFQQICCELHDLKNLDVLIRAVDIFERLSAHYTMAHVHANNVHPLVNMGGVLVPNLLEVTLIRKDVVATAPGADRFTLDRQNVSHVPDADLTSFWKLAH